MSSDEALAICQEILTRLTLEEGYEHDCYKRGQQAFESKAFMEDTKTLASLPALFGVNWKQIRYHHLVRLGADIERAGLGDYPKATLLGSMLLYQQEPKSQSSKDWMGITSVCAG